MREKILNKLLAGLFFFVIIVSLVAGFRDASSPNGLPKDELPPTGSVIRVEASFEDGAFVGTFAGKRLFYQSPGLANNRVRVVLEAGKAYEVVQQKIQNGGHQIVLLLVNK